MLPNFLIIGAARCATGWISQCLREHPDIFVAADETRFFDENYKKGLNWWEQVYFNTWKSEKAVGEKTANYIFEPSVPARIASFSSDVKLICCFRDPIDRMYSHYVHQSTRKKDRVTVPFTSYIDPESDLVRRGFYFQQIKRFMSFFPRDNVLIKIYEDKDEDPLSFIQEIFHFLDVDKGYVPPSTGYQTKRGAAERKNWFWRNLSGYMNSPNTPASLRVLYNKMRPEQIVAELSPEELVKYAGLFREDVEELERLLKRDLNCWLTKKIVQV